MKHVHKCKECQQVSLKEQCYVDSNLQIPKQPMSFIAMDLLDEYPEIENGNCYALTIICMLALHVNIIPIKDKKSEMVINVYIKYICADKGGTKCILSDKSKEFSSASLTYITDQIGFTEVYTSPYSPCLNSVIERCHNFLKNSIRKLRCNLERDLDQLAHNALIAYNIFHTQLQVKVHSFSCTDKMHTYQHYTICYNQRYATWVMMNARYTCMQ